MSRTIVYTDGTAFLGLGNERYHMQWKFTAISVPELQPDGTYYIEFPKGELYGSYLFNTHDRNDGIMLENGGRYFGKGLHRLAVVLKNRTNEQAIDTLP